MKKSICTHFYFMGALLLVVGVLGVSFPAFAGSIILPPEKAHALVSEYQTRITLAENEILALEENLVWLEMKISAMEKSRKSIPSHLYSSVRYKKKRIQVLDLSVERLAQCLAEVREHIPRAVKKDPVQPFSSLSEQQARVKEQLKTAGLMDWFEVVEDQSVAAAKTRLPILFASGSAVIADEYAPFLEKVSVFMKTHGTWAIVDGFTDINPIKTKQFASNFELGAIRAANIVHSLVEQGADPSFFKVSTTGQYRFPDARPVSKNKAVERYVHITLIFDQKI